jgi:hypothetical protein
MTRVADDRVLQDFPDCVIGWQIGKLHRMAKRKVYKTTTVLRAKAASSKARSVRSGKKKASREAELRPKQVLSVHCPTCGAGSGEKCKLGTGLPRTAPHRDRRLTVKDLA